METMYCYKLDENGIRKYEITNYTRYVDGFRRDTFDVFASLGAKTPSNHHVKVKNLDKCFQGFLFTFTLTDEQAKEIILATVKERLDKVRNDVERITKSYEKAKEYLL